MAPRYVLMLSVVTTTLPVRVEAFLDLELVQREVYEYDLTLADETLSNAVASLAIGKHLLLNGGKAQDRIDLARVLARAAVSAKRSIGYVEVHMATSVPDDPRQVQVPQWGRGILADVADVSCWLVVFDVDVWNFSGSGLAQALAERKGTRGSWRLVATSASLARRPLHPGWRRIAQQFAWVDLTPEAA